MDSTRLGCFVLIVEIIAYHCSKQLMHVSSFKLSESIISGYHRTLMCFINLESSMMNLMLSFL